MGSKTTRPSFGLVKAWYEAKCQWSQTNSYAFPDEHQSYHPQGLVKVGNEIFLSTVNKEGKKETEKQTGYIFKLKIIKGSNNLQYVKHISLSNIVEGEEQKEFHPGGMDYDKKTKSIVIPLSQYKANSTTSFVYLNPQSMKHKTIYTDTDHYGSVICSNDQLFAANWNAEALKLIEDNKITLIDKMPASYQDCKFIDQTIQNHLTHYYALCGGISGIGNIYWDFSFSLPSFYKDGYLDLVKFSIDSNTQKGSIEVLGSRLVDVVDGLALTHNTLELEQINIDNTKSILRFYFAPHDNQRTRLFTYDSPVFEKNINGDYFVVKSS